MSSGRLMSRLVKNSGQAALIVKYISSFLLVFSNENLHPLKKVINLCSSVITNVNKIYCLRSFYFTPGVWKMWLFLQPILDVLEIGVSGVNIFVQFLSDVNLEFGAWLY